jgi:Flp pilus assembly protein TadD
MEERALPQQPPEVSGPAGVRPLAGAAAAIAALVAAIYWPVRTFPFVNLDDPQYVQANPLVAGGLSWRSAAHAFAALDAANWHPVTWLSHMLDVELFGLAPGAHHVVSVALHAANAVLLLLLLWRATGSVGRSALAAALFAVHPLRVESVAWISERKDVLSTLFLLLALHAWVAYVRRPRPGPYLAALALFAVGLLAKSMLVTVPAVLLLLDAWPLGRLERELEPAERARRLRGLLVEKLPFAALSMGAAAMTLLAQGRGDTVASLAAIPVGERIANAAVSCVAYLGLAAWPDRLAAFYPHVAVLGGKVPWGEAALCGAALAGVTALAVRERRRRPWLPFGWAFYLVTLLPVIGLVQVGEQARADRYTYVPLMGVAVAVSWGAAELCGKLRLPRLARLAAALACVLALSVAARRQVGVWSDSATLHANAIAVTERNWKAWGGFADALVAAGRPTEALSAANESLRLLPDQPHVLNSLGVAHAMLGRPEQAAVHLERAVTVRPNYADGWYNLGNARAARGDHREAARCFARAVALRPGDARAWGNLAIASALAGDRATARAARVRLESLDPPQAARLAAAWGSLAEPSPPPGAAEEPP